jgi:hypothetical protein
MLKRITFLFAALLLALLIASESAKAAPVPQPFRATCFSFVYPWGGGVWGYGTALLYPDSSHPSNYTGTCIVNLGAVRPGVSCTTSIAANQAPPGFWTPSAPGSALLHWDNGTTTGAAGSCLVN